MENIKEALKDLPHIQSVWVDPTDSNAWFYRAKPGFKEYTRAEIMDGKIESKNKK
jgi:hypothetical protein